MTALITFRDENCDELIVESKLVDRRVRPATPPPIRSLRRCRLGAMLRLQTSRELNLPRFVVGSWMAPFQCVLATDAAGITILMFNYVSI